MNIKQFTYASIRLLGAIAIFRGFAALFGLAYFLWSGSAHMTHGQKLVNAGMLNLAYQFIFPVAVGLICIYATDKLTLLVIKGIERIDS